MLAAISTTLPITNDSHSNNIPNIKPKCQPIIMILDMLNFIAKIVNISATIVENQYSSILQKNKNKLMHAMNRNIYTKSNVKSHLKIAQINKGNSNLTTKLNNIISLVKKSQTF